MTTLLNWPPLPIPISTQWRTRCDRHARSHVRSIRTAETNAPKTKKEEEAAGVAAYQQTLAILVIQYYLRMIDVPHRLETLPSGFTLYVEELGGYLTCCPLPPAAQKCLIPEHNRTPQKGYFFVELSAPYHQAQVLGFVRQVSVSELPVSYLQPLHTFVEALAQKTEKTSKITSALFPHISLSDWVQGQIAGWQLPKTLPPAIRPAQAMRSSIQEHRAPNHDLPLYERYAVAQGDVVLAKSLTNVTPTAALTQIIITTTDDVIRWHAAERLVQQNGNTLQGPTFQVKSLADDLDGLPIALLVGTVPKSDETFLVGCRLYRLQNDPSEQYALPDNLVLQGVENRNPEEGNIVEAGQVFCQLTPATHGDPLEYLFTAEVGDCFSLRVCYQEKSVVNTFIL